MLTAGESRFTTIPIGMTNNDEAKLVRRAWRYAWSSAAAHCGGRGPIGLLDLAAWRKRLPPEAHWREALQSPGDADLVGRLRRRTSTGWPLAADSFLSKLERRLGRRLRPLPRGRPKKRKNNK